jgi:hypothetical protein
MKTTSTAQKVDRIFALSYLSILRAGNTRLCIQTTREFATQRQSTLTKV